MEEYLTIPTQRLAALAYRLLDKSTVSKLVQNLYRTCMSPRQAANVLEGIVNMDDKRQERHSIYMKMSAVQRNALAHSLTHDLREAEKQVGVMLIKPIFGTKVPLSQDLITPLPRSLPVDQHHLARTSPASFHGSSSSARQITRTDRTSAPQSRITRTQTAFPLLHRRQKQQEPKKDVCRASTANPSEPQIQYLVHPRHVTINPKSIHTTEIDHKKLRKSLSPFVLLHIICYIYARLVHADCEHTHGFPREFIVIK